MSVVLDYYADCFAAHGDTARGSGWPNDIDRETRFDVALDLVEYLAPAGPVVVCDLGCGTGELLRRIRGRGLDRIEYVGVDGLEAPLLQARAKFPGVPFRHLEAAAGAAPAGAMDCDVLVANGLFTVKRSLSSEEMWRYMTGVLEAVWPGVRRGIVFNVMSPVVAWEREDLFHLSYDRLAAFLHGLAGRQIGFRADYGLYEYMAYARKRPDGDAGSAPRRAAP